MPVIRNNNAPFGHINKREKWIMRISQLLSTLIALCFIMPLGSGSLAEGSARVIEIHAHRFAFEPAEITVKKGETVQLHLISDDVKHSLSIPDLGINVAASKGHPGDATLTPKNDGDFHGRCGTFCGSGHGKMLFTVHVTGN
jgi:cytochrome c oxidase subunit II